MSFWSEIKTRFRNGDALIRLLFVNIGVFLVINLYLLALYLFKLSPAAFLGDNLALAASSDWKIMLIRPWSIITHMFAHIQFGHFLFNMIALYFMGQLFVSIKGSKRLLSLYLLGGLSGYLLFAISLNVFDVFNTNHSVYVLGASAAVMAITVASATLQPKREILLFGAIKMELMWLAAILILLDLASVRSGINSGGHIGHIGGAIFGFFYARQLQKGKEMGSWLTRLLDRLSGFLSKRRMRVVSNTQQHSRPKSDEQFNIEKKERERRTDEILDKISRSGYDSLSKSEKEFLFKNAQK